MRIAQLFCEPKDYYALVNLKRLKILLVHEISSENDAKRIIDGNNFRGEAFAIILLFLYLVSIPAEMFRPVPD